MSGFGQRPGIDREWLLPQSTPCESRGRRWLHLSSGQRQAESRLEEKP